ncbi:MAG: TetR/AcrR family transcriptional regulator [Bacteroidota bacterium]
MKNTQNILKRAEKLFLSLGIRSVSMDDISRGLGISKKTLYQHFENKDALVKMVIESHIDREQEEINEILASAKDALEELFKLSNKVIHNIKDVSPGTLHDLQKYYRPSFEILMKKQNDFIFQCFYKNIQRGIKEGLFREDANAEIVSHLYANTSFYVVEALSDPNFKYTKKELIEELYDYHVRGIATPKGIRKWEKIKQITATELRASASVL